METSNEMSGRVRGRRCLAHRRRFPLQFGIRDLPLLLCCAAILLGWWKSADNQKKKEDSLVWWLQAGAKFQSFAPPIIGRLFPQGTFDRVSECAIHGPIHLHGEGELVELQEIEKSLVDDLRGFSRLESLELSGFTVSKNSAEHLRFVRRLRVLKLVGCNVVDERVLDDIAAMPNIGELRVSTFRAGQFELVEWRP